MEELAAVGNQEQQLSDDEETVEFEIEIVSSSASSLSASRAASPSKELIDESAPAAATQDGQSCQEQLGATGRLAQAGASETLKEDDVVDLTIEQSPPQEVAARVEVDIDAAAIADNCQSEPEAAGINDNLRAVDAYDAPRSTFAGTGNGGEIIPVEDPTRDDSSHESTRSELVSEAAPIGSDSLQTSSRNDLKPTQETLEDCRPVAASNVLERGQCTAEAQALESGQGMDVEVVKDERPNEPEVKATSAQPCTECGPRFVTERVELPDGWQLIDAYDLDRAHSSEPMTSAQVQAVIRPLEQGAREDLSDRLAEQSELAPSFNGADRQPLTNSTTSGAPVDQSRSFDEDENKEQQLSCLDDVSIHVEEALQVEIRAGALERKWSSDDGQDVDANDDKFQESQCSCDGATAAAAAAAISDILDERHQIMNQLANLDRLSSSSSLHLLNSEANLFDEEDLEREFDEEPDFKRREVQVKRNKDPRAEYELGSELGRGKFGTVFRCVERASNLQLAAKFITMRRREDREDVEREVAIMSVLQHKRLLQLYDAFDDGQQEMCLITELVEGGELFERIVDDDFDLTEKKAAIFMRQICEGVEYMHGEQIVHLDMKPENILCLSRTGIRIKLIDFGLARRLDPQKPIRVLFGTPDFAAPEVLAYETVTLATDMWSVGVICYVLLSGLSPFMGDSDMDTMANVMRATFDFNDQAFEAISDLAKDFISKLLVRDPAARLRPAECLKHAWLRRGGGPLDAHIRERRESSFSLMLGNQHRLALEKAAMMAAAEQGKPADPSTPPLQIPNVVNMRARGSFGAESTLSAGHQSLDKRRLKRYVVRRKWHKTVHAIMALGRMGANLKRLA